MARWVDSILLRWMRFTMLPQLSLTAAHCAKTLITASVSCNPVLKQCTRLLLPSLVECLAKGAAFSDDASSARRLLSLGGADPAPQVVYLVAKPTLCGTNPKVMPQHRHSSSRTCTRSMQPGMVRVPFGPGLPPLPPSRPPRASTRSHSHSRPAPARPSRSPWNVSAHCWQAV